MTASLTVRLWCTPSSDTPLGKLAWKFVEIATCDLRLPCRILPPPPNVMHASMLPEDWQQFAPLLGVAIAGPYVNVVASDDPNDWARLWTTGVRNVILTSRACPTLATDHPIKSGGFGGVLVPALSSLSLHLSWEAEGLTATEIFSFPPVHQEATRARIRRVLGA